MDKRCAWALTIVAVVLSNLAYHAAEFTYYEWVAERAKAAIQQYEDQAKVQQPDNGITMNDDGSYRIEL
jgi:hypothetical protein